MSNKVKLYHTKQYSDNDCGISCLVSVYKYFGKHDVSNDSLKDIVMKADDYSIKDLISITRHFDLFTTKAIKVKKENFIKAASSIEMPIIALINQSDYRNHYIVIYKIEKNYLLISDPNKKTISKMLLKDFLKVFSGVLLVISKKEDSSIANDSYSNSNLSKKTYLIKIFKSNKMILTFTFVLSLLIIALTLASSLFVKYIVDVILPNHFEHLLITFSLVFLGINAMNVLFDYFRNLLIIKMSLKLDLSVTKDFFDKITKLPFTFFEKRDSGDVISRFNDSTHIRDIFSITLISSLLDSFILLGMGVFLYKINSILFLTTLLPLLILLSLSLIFMDSIKEKNQIVMRKASLTNSFLIQFISNMGTIFSLNKIDFFNKKFNTIFIDQMKSTVKEHKVVNLNNSFKALTQSAFSVIILWIGAQQVLNESITLGTLLLINTIVIFMLNSLDSLITIQSEIQRAFVAIDRIFNILNYPTEDENNRNYIINEKVEKIEVKKLSYSYDKFHNIFSNINLEIKKNEKILISGASGSGKSTLAKLISNLYESPMNTIFINKIDINLFKSEHLKKTMIYQDEHPFFFSGTLLENLTMGLDVELEDIINACKNAQIYDFIASKENNFDFYILEHGSNLSTGQKQRLAFARILLHNPEVIILDESLSNVDQESLSKIYEFINQHNCILIYISHDALKGIDFSQKLYFDGEDLVKDKLREGALL